MADQRQAGGPGSKPGSKPGSDPDAARKFAEGGGDFGVPVDSVRDREYTSRNTKNADPGAAQPHGGESGDRTTGAGATASGPGSSSGGDIDTDLIGVGTGGSGIAQSGEVGRPPGPDDSDGTSNEMASGPPSRGEGDRSGVRKVGGAAPIHGTVHSPADDLPSGPGGGQGADSATNPARNDDAFAGEVSMGEAGGQDTPAKDRR